MTVVIPTYNSAEFFDEALQGVFNQTISDYEIIVVDDSSTDQAKQVIDRYSNKIRCIFQKNTASAKKIGT